MLIFAAMTHSSEILGLEKRDRQIKGTVQLDGSKSISNRALIILALAGGDPDQLLHNLSTSKDTVTLNRLLRYEGDTYDAGDAGTTFRFLTAYLATQPGVQVLTGSARMRERPVGPLVDALRQLGADISFLEKDGYPPLRIGAPADLGEKGNEIHIHAGTSSQFLSALLLVAPYLPNGLVLIPEGPLVSRPYLEMTLRLMQYFGADAGWQGDSVLVKPGSYQMRPFSVESDWSAASYWYAMAAFASVLDLRLDGLQANSWQGDAALVPMMRAFGIQTEYLDGGIRLSKIANHQQADFAWDFLECPDIAQTLAVVCGGLGVKGVFSGLETLAIKETDRTAALTAELSKVGVNFYAISGSGSQYAVTGKAAPAERPRFASYGDHRMAMSFAPLALFFPIEIENPAVVNKSYPQFWAHLESVGFELGSQAM